MSPLSIVLALGFLYGLWLIPSLIRSKVNAGANRYLAGLIFLVSLKLVPYVLGFSGFYQRYAWLNYAPFEIDAGFGPLLYLYVTALTQTGPPKRQWVHLLPAAAEFVYYLAVWVQPLSVKDRWHDQVQIYVDKVDYAYGVASLTVYLVLAFLKTTEYRRTVAETRTQGEPETVRFLRGVLKCVGVYVALRAAFGVASILRPDLGFADFYLSYFWLSILIYVLGTGVSRLKESVQPLDTMPTEEVEVAAKPSPSRDWVRVAEQIDQRTIELRPWTDPDLSLETFSEQVGYSSGYVSKALNLGKGMSFSDYINEYRIKQIQDCLRNPSDHRDFIELAFECGFNSKASFNRIYKKLTGETPSETRNRLRTGPEPNP